MSDSLSFKYILTEDDFVRALRAHAFKQIPRWSLWILLAALLFLQASGIHYIVTWPQASAFGVIWLILVTVLPGVWFCWIRWWHPKRVIREAPYLNVEIEGTASVDGVVSRSRLGNHETAWGSYSAVFESVDYFLLYLGRNVFNPLPKRSFADTQDVDRFRDLIRAHVPNTRLQDRPEKG